MRKVWITGSFLLSAGALIAAPTGGSACQSLSKVSLPHVTITQAEDVSAGAFTPPPSPGPFGPNPALFKSLPAFCRVMAKLTPSSDSDIKVEVWLPASGWNNDFQAIGNGGWNGTIGYAALAEGVKSGYATAATDTGHEGGSASFAMGHPEKLTDFAYRAVHDMTITAKAIVKDYYGAAPRYSYWNGCSTGGRQGLKEAQKFPADFDGIIAGAPANYQTHLHVWSVWLAQQMNKTPESYVPPAKLAVLHKAVLAACDAADGVQDGLINDPTRCHFDPKTIECKGADEPTCLSSAQVEAVTAIYAGPKDPNTGKEIFPTFEPGSELGWNLLAGKEAASVAADSFTYVVYKNPKWDWRTMNLDSDVKAIEKSYGTLIDATDPNMKPFFSHKGKLLMYHGWSDQAIAPENSVNYYQSVVKNLGGEAKASDDIRLFMVPAMAHCGGGEGPNDFDKMTAIRNWVEGGKAPEVMIASRKDRSGTVQRTRPLCPYPQIAKYKGSGSIDDAANFTCALP
ncbi:MAG TPA: tannase/feruloyl esterase family alpha/beta hydrolase [Bryobacteraceae bacterium]|nr:tannase/feruloyl esterase family alpha/beta hydrolase [Bryobacteraceae bacterium]